MIVIVLLVGVLGGVAPGLYGDFQRCMGGPDGGIPIEWCQDFDADGDLDVDLKDWSRLLP